MQMRSDLTFFSSVKMIGCSGYFHLVLKTWSFLYACFLFFFVFFCTEQGIIWLVINTGWGVYAWLYPSYLWFALAVTSLLGSFITLPLHSLQKTPKQQKLLWFWLRKRKKKRETKKALITRSGLMGTPWHQHCHTDTEFTPNTEVQS
jgi:hypothetical protein